MSHRLRLVGLLCFTLLCCTLSVSPSQATTPHRVFVPVASIPMPEIAYIRYVQEYPNQPPKPDNIYIGSRTGNSYQLTFTTNIWYTALAWSPDHTRIAYFDDATDTISIINVANPTQPRPVVTITSDRSFDMEWSPRGDRLAFSNEAQIYTVKIDGTDLQQITDGSGVKVSPTWSADGTKIAYVRDIYAPYGGAIFVTQANGSETVQLTTNETHGTVRDLDWSLAGTRIAYARMNGASSRIYVMQADGSNPTPISGSDDRMDDDFHPVWSPDGQHILFRRHPESTLLSFYNLIINVETRTEEYVGFHGAWAR